MTLTTARRKILREHRRKILRLYEGQTAGVRLTFLVRTNENPYPELA